MNALSLQMLLNFMHFTTSVQLYRTHLHGGISRNRLKATACLDSTWVVSKILLLHRPEQLPDWLCLSSLEQAQPPLRLPSSRAWRPGTLGMVMAQTHLCKARLTALIEGRGPAGELHPQGPGLLGRVGQPAQCRQRGHAGLPSRPASAGRRSSAVRMLGPRPAQVRGGVGKL